MIPKEKFESILLQVRKPGRYVGNEWNAVKKDLGKTALNVALAFPDLYEIGMSNLGYKILYHLLNDQGDIACERVFLPDLDLADLLKKGSLPLFTLESREPVRSFDILGFSLAYELNYTNLLAILDLAGIPLKTQDRRDGDPLVIAGGSCVLNPEPMSDFIDLFVIGEAEDVFLELAGKMKLYKTKKIDRCELLLALSGIDGVYVPSLYGASYNPDNTFQKLDPVRDGVPSVIRKRKIADLDKAFYPKDQIVPNVAIVHDRVSVEIMRGCPNLCRFCQARVLYHPKRERSLEKITTLALESVKRTGYEEVSLLSLSSGDHSDIKPVLKELTERFRKDAICVSLPSLRVEDALKEFPSMLKQIKKSGLTFAPEAGTERLRSVLNKKIRIAGLKEAVLAARREGWMSVKLYFMIGLPTETDEDISGIADMIRDLAAIDRRLQINVTVNSFIPKPHTPFQYEPMDKEEELRRKMRLLKERTGKGRIKLKFQDVRPSILEGVLCQGDRRVGRAVLNAFNKGCRLDGWTEHLKSDAWAAAFKEEGIDPAFYIYRLKPVGSALPWDHIDTGVTKAYLIKERAEGLTKNLSSSIL